MQKMKSVAGPNPYPPAPGVGIPVAFGEFEQVNFAEAKCDRDGILEADDTIYALRTAIVTNVVTVRVFSCATVGAPGNAWAEIGALNLSALTFTVLADGE